MASGGSLFDPEMELEDGIEVVGIGASAGSEGLRDPHGLPFESVLSADSAGQDVASESKTAGGASALLGAGHGKFPGIGFREVALPGHRVHVGFRVAAASPGNGGCRMDLFDSK